MQKLLHPPAVSQAEFGNNSTALPIEDETADSDLKDQEITDSDLKVQEFTSIKR